VNPLLRPGLPLVVAHRGASAERPENTLESFRLALEQGADALELDVRATADGEAIVIHDATLDRTTELSGPVRDRTLAELRGADAGARYTSDRGRTFPWRDRGVRLPTLAEVLAAFPETPLLIEVKEPAAQEPARRAIERADAAARCVLASADAAALDAFRAKPFLCGAAGPDIAALYFPTMLGLAPSTLAPVAYAVPLRWRGLTIPTRRVVATARRCGRPVHVWTVDDPTLAVQLWQRGVSGIVTNRPAVIVATRRAMLGATR
jgi:glycerophosphoryl diester phosphodiesterase